jgi:F-type H+-transporting ATPase subunit a
MGSFLYNLPTFLADETLHAAAEHAEGASAEGAHHGLSFLGLMFYVILVLATVFGLMAAAKKGINNRFFTNKVTQWFEQLYLFIENLCIGIIGEHGRKYIPMMMTFWLVIFISNLYGLFMASTPTADLSFNFAMALIAVGYVQWEGMRTNGFKHWLHFAGPKLPIAMIPITILIFVVELISEAMKNLSLSLRLYGNIDGGHRAAEAMNELGWHINAGGFEFGIPVGAFLFPVKLLTCVVQALIFCLLTCVYISLVTSHHDDHEHEGHGEAAHAH